ncbi:MULTISPECIES: DUF3107 domain-containing protein [Gulosibacter]|uniref:DUF3107 domain-containing protein n=1 Tax=Gulosibacter TaxID=256818 RepID=UPI00191AE627|nr:DUF3107 domain-containing protein [Gulosibacter hominis]
MELRIGILHSPRELSFETNASSAEVEQLVTGGDSIIRFEDDRQRVYLVNREQIAYVEIGEEAARRVGFVA